VVAALVEDRMDVGLSWIEKKRSFVMTATRSASRLGGEHVYVNVMSARMDSNGKRRDAKEARKKELEEKKAETRKGRNESQDSRWKGHSREGWKHGRRARMRQECRKLGLKARTWERRGPESGNVLIQMMFSG
jgi:hypothetical protein